MTRSAPDTTTRLRSSFPPVSAPAAATAFAPMWQCVAVLGALLLCVVSMPASAQWKWRDAKGQVHISDIPPPRDIPEKDVMQKPDPASRKPVAAPVAASAASAAVAPKPGTDPELEERRRRGEQEKAAKAKSEEDKLAALRKENCNRAREQLNTLDSGIRIARVKANGEREILDDEQRAAEAHRMREAMAVDCR